MGMKSDEDDDLETADENNLEALDVHEKEEFTNVLFQAGLKDRQCDHLKNINSEGAALPHLTIDDQVIFPNDVLAYDCRPFSLLLFCRLFL